MVITFYFKCIQSQNFSYISPDTIKVLVQLLCCDLRIKRVGKFQANGRPSIDTDYNRGFHFLLAQRRFVQHFWQTRFFLLTVDNSMDKPAKANKIQVATDKAIMTQCGKFHSGFCASRILHFSDNLPCNIAYLVP